MVALKTCSEFFEILDLNTEMSLYFNPLDYLLLDPQVVFGPRCLNLPALPLHLPLVILSAIFYQLVYSVVAPWLWRALEKLNPSPAPLKITHSLWHINIVSIAQSCISTALSFYLSSHREFRHDLSPQEMILGYHRETTRALAVTTGYFVFHLGSTWVQREFHGMFMFGHAMCALFAVSLGFRPLALHYTGAYLLWELPNIFLNFQRQLDNSGRRKTWYRTVNRGFLLSTYAIFRLALGSMTIFQMGRDMILTRRDPHPKLGVQHIVPPLLSTGHQGVQEVQTMPVVLAIIQLGSMAFLHLQGFYWFSKILLKGDLRKVK
ncbi:Topoisomerase I damage affected 4 [Hyphodiscus hymeniophilus]|uniref:Topoisomerase I damage affected 4 n=1 Tax=Hyphodiscus hymeniophilus TaxID=353542 RepID=A0A9P6VMC6_9HELO|nr:Topoisomerase I damage affected 4 [Hyphodiscus hymeniophilus]